MNKEKIILILGILAVILISGCVQKECEADADCLTKTCFTVQCTDNKCVHSPISDCCGNEKCEPGETYSECVADCPNCDDTNKCTVDSYDYHEQKCVNAPILDVVCCGNGLCEIGETYSTCARDCPNCDDDNECTKDSYDYHQHKCINEPIIPCCGNGICDKDAETYSTCPTDCPNCDDKNKLTADSFNYKTQKCENIVTHYFIDDFEGDIKNWAFHGKGNWSTVVEDGNTFLRLTGVVRPDLQKEWTDYGFKFRVKRIEGSMHVNFRKSSTKEGQNRYIVNIHPGEVGSLGEQLGESFQKLKEIGLRFDENWHTLEIRGYNNILNVYLDDELLVKYKDTENPFLSGMPGFEIHTGGAPVQPEFLIDDVEIKVVTEKDISYP